MGKTVTNIVSAGLMVAGVIVTGGLGTALIAAGIAVQAAGSMIFKDKMPSGYRDQSERKQMLRSPTAPETIIVGKTVCSGLLFFAEEEKGEQTENERLFLALAIAAHKLDHIGQIWLNDDLIGEFGDKAEYEFHNGRTDCDPYMLKNAPSWKEDMIGDGLAWLRLTLKYDAEKFPYGVPNVKVEVWGKQIYDPRTDKTVWSNNGALVILDYYRSYLSVPDSDIDFDAFKVAADLCDEPVTTPEGNTEPRYTINGAYELSESPASILDHMHKCIAAEPTYVAGKHGILMQAYNGPAVLRIEPNQIIDTVNITPELALRDATNAIYGTFVDAEQQYIKTDFEPVIVDEWVDEDGLEIKENMDYRFVSSPYQAARLANLYLRKKRAGRRIQLKMNMDGYAYRPGDVVLLNLPQIGIQNFECRVAEWKFHPQEGVDILLEEDGAYIYEDIVGKPFVRPPFTVLPTGGVAPPLNLTFVATNIGEVVQGYLSWQSAAADVRYNTVNILEAGKVIQSIQVPSDRVDLSGLVRGSYRAEVRSINAAGAMSAPAIVDFDIQAPPKPVSVEMVGGMFSLTCIPHGGDTAQHGYTFEFWFSDKKLASTNDTEVTTKANRQGQGQFWTKENLKAGTDYWFYVRTVNSYGKSQFVEAVGKADGTPKEMLDEIGHNFLSNEAGQKLQEQIDFSKEAIADLEMDAADVRQKVVSIDRDVEAVNEAVMTLTQFSTENYYELKEESAKGQASIKHLEQVQADFTASQAKYQQEVAAQFEHTAADVLNVQNALAKSNEAFAEDIRQVRADLGETNEEVGTIKGRVTTVETATADLKQSQAKLEQSTTAEFGEMRGYITHFETSLSNVELAVSEAIMQTTAQVNQHSSELLQSKADVKRIANATATNEKATAELAESVKAHYEDSQAEFVDVRKSIAEQDKAHSERTEQVRAELGKDINANKEEVDKTNKELSDISAAVTTNTKAIAETDKTLTELEQVSSSRFDSNEATIANIQNTQANADSSQAETTLQLAAQQNEQGSELLRAKASIRETNKIIVDNDKAYAQKFTQLDSQFEQVNARFTRVESTLADAQQSITETKEQLYSEINSVDRKVTAVDQKVDQTKATLEGAIAESNHTLSAKVEAAQDTANTAKSNAADAKQDIDRYKNSNDQRMLLAETQITANKQAIANEQETRGSQINKINSELGGLNAAFEAQAKTYVDQKGNASSVFGIKNAVVVNGQYYEAQMLLGAEVKNGQVVTQIGFSADTFGIFNPSSGKLEPVFFVENGQVFINEAFINQATIEKLLIGSTIKSKNWDPSAKKGLMLDFENGKLIANDAEITGKIYATDGDFRGTVHAEKFIGDVATGVLYEGVSKYFIKQSVMSIETSITYVGGMPYDVDLIMPTMHFSSEHRTPAINRPFEISVFANGVSQNVITTTVNSPDTTWAAIASCYIKIPKYQKDTVIKIRLIGRGNGGDNSDCTLRIHPALVLACKSAPSSFK
ncbi:phage tail tip protein J-related protein [Providencia manganoxydans]|uniref:phage tail tip protein J-related protein n=1 Tax=Providencia manganoxydans TaxID=2923283 RepID=UPI0034DD3C4C